MFLLRMQSHTFCDFTFTKLCLVFWGVEFGCISSGKLNLREMIPSSFTWHFGSFLFVFVTLFF